MHLRSIAFVLLLASRSGLAQQETSPSQVTILVAYDTRTFNTERLARAVMEGVSSVEGVHGLLKPQSEVLDSEILDVAGILVGSPVHWGSVSSKTKEFLDRVANLLVAEKKIGPDATPRTRTAGAFVTAGTVSSGKELARTTILTAFLQMQFIVVGGVDAEGFGTLGPQATTGETDPGLSEEELKEAREFGQRFAQLTLSID